MIKILEKIRYRCLHEINEATYWIPHSNFQTSVDFHKLNQLF